jgi:predicted dehydrogenase
MKKTSVAVVGCGHLGKIHARLLAARDDVKLVAVVDPVADAALQVTETHGCRWLSDPAELTGLVDAAVVAAPTGLHEAVVLPLLAMGIDVLVEKPIAAEPDEAERIVAAARRYGRTVSVGHVERFNPAWQAVCGVISEPMMVESRRLAPFTYRSLDVGVVLDLMIHDIDLVLSLNPGRLESVQAQGLVATGGHEDLMRARLTFDSGFIADLSASRINPTLDRSVSVWSQESLVTVDFASKEVHVIEPSEMVRRGLYSAAAVPPSEWPVRKESFFHDVLPETTHPVPDGNALVAEHDDFLRAIRSGTPPTVTAQKGRDALDVAVRVLQAAVVRRFGAAPATKPWKRAA